MRPLDYQFRRLAFLQVLLGMLAFCIAEGRPLQLALVGLIAVLSWFYTETTGRKGISRPMLNLGAIGAMILLTAEVQATGAGQPVALVGHFTMALQLVLLFADKGRREYLQLVALSTLQMLSASVLPGGVTLIYGLLLLVYVVLALLTALTFQLKSCGDLVYERQKRGAAGNDQPDYPQPVGGPKQRAHFRRSASALGLLCAVCAIAIFIIAPRSQRDGLAVALTPPAGAASQTGFNNTIELGGGAIGTGSTEPVLNLRILNQGASESANGRPWLLRGSVLDYYNPATRTWTRSHQNADRERILEAGPRAVTLANLTGQAMLEAVITLRHIDQQNIFIPTDVAGPVATAWIKVPTQPLVQFNIEDQQLMALVPSSRVQEYTVHFPIQPVGDIREAYNEQLPKAIGVVGAAPLTQEQIQEQENAQRREMQERAQRRRQREAQDINGPWRDRSLRDRRDDYDNRPYRPGRDWSWDQGFTGYYSRPPTPDFNLLWTAEADRTRGLAQAVLAAADLPLDLADADGPTRLRAAHALAQHLRLNYAYTTDNPKAPAKDPVVGFLFQTRAGHCELFASGLAAMCRTVGIPAHVVTGFRASEYNAIGDYYVVRQSHAHAWTEIDAGPGYGWTTFDATPSSAVDQQHLANQGGILGSIRALYDHLEFSWIATVITYDKRAQENLLGAVGDILSAGPDAWARGTGNWIKERANNLEFDQVGYILMGVIVIALVIAITSLIHSLILRRRRLIALQLTALPRTQRRRLAKQLRFYLTMLEILERHDLKRPHWQSPYRFARDLAKQDPLRFEPVVSLTELFYEVRFGHRTLDDLRKHQVRAHLRRLELTISPSAKG